MKNTFFGRVLITYFFRGLLVVVPLTIVVISVWKVFQFLDKLIPYDVPGLGLLTVIGIIMGAGFLASSIFFKPFEDLGNILLDRVPLLKKLYSAIKDVVEALVGNKRKFDRPVLVRFLENSPLEKPGFITNQALQKLGMNGEKVAVYMPHSFAWSGNLYIVPAEFVTPVDIKPGEMMTFIVSAGVVEVDEESVTKD
jgi:uncharacterized membrane protein